MSKTVAEAMSRHVCLIGRDETVEEAARRMRRLDVGLLPVAEGNRLVGVVTDRDIAVRGVASGKGPTATVRQVMTDGVHHCFETQSIAEATQIMSAEKVRRLVVLDQRERLVGILSLGDVSTGPAPRTAALTLEHISKPGGDPGRTSDGRWDRPGR